MAFSDEIKKHLEAYKAPRFNVTEYPHGLWKNNPEKVLKYAFTPEKSDFNLIPIYKDRFLEYEKKLEKQKKISRHMYFHHMNSSQAMCINFFFPLLQEHNLEHITDYFGFAGERVIYDSVQFEKLSEIEPHYGHTPTNFDFYFETESGKKFFFEIKYTEYQFASAVEDEEHVVKYDKVYSNHLTPICEEFHGFQKFISNYQLLRNLIHVSQNSYVVFIFPEGNTRIRKEAEMAVNRIITEEFKSNIRTVTWEDIFKKVSQCVTQGELKEHFAEFRRKYYINSSLNEVGDLVSGRKRVRTTQLLNKNENNQEIL
jgi:hypothetical protein